MIAILLASKEGRDEIQNQVTDRDSQSIGANAHPDPLIQKTLKNCKIFDLERKNENGDFSTYLRIFIKGQGSSKSLSDW